MSIKEIGLLIKHTRKQNKTSQTELAKLLGVTQATVSKYEDGSMGFSANVWLNFCNLYRIDPFILLEGEETNE